jgi:hypothetical protein
MNAEELRDINEEIAMLDQIEARSDLDINMARKMSQADYHRKSQKRGRPKRGGE